MDDSTAFIARLAEPYLAAAATRELRLEMRALAPKERPDLRVAFSEWFPLSRAGFMGASAWSLRWAREYNVYCAVLPRLGRTRFAADVPAAGYLWCEIDGKNDGQEGALAMLEKAGHLPSPDMTVGSGGGIHAYWRLADPVAIETSEDRRAFNETLLRLAYAVGGLVWQKDDWGNYTGKAKPTYPDRAYADPSCCDVARILRVPGTFNHKPDRQCTVEFTGRTRADEHHSLTAWQAALKPRPVSAPRPRPAEKRLSPGETRPISDAMRTKLYNSIYPVGTKYPTLRALLFYLRRQGWGPYALEEYARDFCARHGRMDMRTVQSLVNDTAAHVSVSID